MLITSYCFFVNNYGYRYRFWNEVSSMTYFWWQFLWPSKWQFLRFKKVLYSVRNRVLYDILSAFHIASGDNAARVWCFWNSSQRRGPRSLYYVQ